MIREGTIEEAVNVSLMIPEFEDPYKVDEYQKRLLNRPHLVLIATNDNQLVGFKVGYALDEGIFYSWMGGVIPDYRKKGIAQRLLEHQEAWAILHEYKKIFVKTLNKHRGMLTFLIKNGYNIVGFTPNVSVEKNQIRFQKILNKKLSH
ncbi:MAG: GNAT family N-acetyltransferase [Anaerolineales bacterium]